mmetsp:Transcript_2338/g.3909  ORF Transcript_2338/g.3909 Transcript_2338/m.3909 type:complete len:90 (+) Transcript_2338:104-373(+)
MPVSNMENLNTKEYLENVKVQLFDILKQVEPVPGVQIQTGSSMQTPADLAMPEKDDESQNPDERNMDTEKKEHPAEFYPAETGDKMDTS